MVLPLAEDPGFKPGPGTKVLKTNHVPDLEYREVARVPPRTPQHSGAGPTASPGEPRCGELGVGLGAGSGVGLGVSSILISLLSLAP